MTTNAGKLSIARACELLGVSRPTFNEYRKRFRFKEVREGRRVFFFRTDVFSKTPPKAVMSDKSLIVVNDCTVDELLVDDAVFDLRGIHLIDPHGVMSLLCSVLGRAQEGKSVRLLVDDSFNTRRLHSLGFFHELERDAALDISWDKSQVVTSGASDPDVFLPIQYIRHRGGERRVAENLIRMLIKHGFSEEIGGSIGWIFGELSDNALTHSKGPCYLMCERFITEKKDDLNYLVIAIADMGVGIHNSLRTNERYSRLDDKTALLTAFKSNVTCWDDEHKRGKGLTDVVKISLGNKSYFRVESTGLGFVLPWEKKAFNVRPMCAVSGTRYTIVLTDDAFAHVSREIADAHVDNWLATL